MLGYVRNKFPNMVIDLPITELHPDFKVHYDLYHRDNRKLWNM
jgi:hypothetical protein